MASISLVWLIAYGGGNYAVQSYPMRSEKWKEWGMSVGNLNKITIARRAFATCVPCEDLFEHGARSIPVSSPDSSCQTGPRLLNSPAHSCLCCFGSFSSLSHPSWTR